MVRRGRSWRASLALLALSCAPPAVVRPGSREAPSVFRVRSGARSVVLSGTMIGWWKVLLERRDGAFELSL